VEFPAVPRRGHAIAATCEDGEMELGDVSIRRADSADGAHVWPLVQEFAVTVQPQFASFRSAYDELVDRRYTLLLVALDAHEGVCGYLLASHHQTLFANGPVAWIEEVMVEQEARGIGIGGLLLSEAERWAGSVPVTYLALASHRAGRFYLDHGYEASATFFKKVLYPPSLSC
jgi:GNAT superfamily N-acetyltransferase